MAIDQIFGFTAPESLTDSLIYQEVLGHIHDAVLVSSEPKFPCRNNLPIMTPLENTDLFETNFIKKVFREV